VYWSSYSFCLRVASSSASGFFAAGAFGRVSGKREMCPEGSVSGALELVECRKEEWGEG
jgi:hypothetical protein